MKKKIVRSKDGPCIVEKKSKLTWIFKIFLVVIIISTLIVLYSLAVSHPAARHWHIQRTGAFCHFASFLY